MPQIAKWLRAMKLSSSQRNDLVWALALAVPLAARLLGEDAQAASQRLQLLALAFAVAAAWAWVFARAARRPLGSGVPAFAMGFVVMLPGPVGWGSALLALSFGAVFGREIFGGRAILPPALIGLAFAIYSFPVAGFETLDVVAQPPDATLALACLAGAAVVLALRGGLAWQVALGAVVGVMLPGLLMDGPPWWEHLGRGGFAAGVLFLAAAPQSAVGRPSARFVHGLLVGALVVVFRLANPEHPDGVVFAALLGALFAPLIDRAWGWRLQRG